MSEVTIITFANQKGGVGKTTLCTLFANYLVNRGKRTIVIDCDGQQTIFEKRKADYKKYPDQKEKTILYVRISTRPLPSTPP